MFQFPGSGQQACLKSEFLTILPLQAATVMIFFTITHLKLFLQGIGGQSKVYIATLNPFWFFVCLLERL